MVVWFVLSVTVGPHRAGVIGVIGGEGSIRIVGGLGSGGYGRGRGRWGLF